MLQQRIQTFLEVANCLSFCQLILIFSSTNDILKPPFKTIVL